MNRGLKKYFIFIMILVGLIIIAMPKFINNSSKRLTSNNIANCRMVTTKTLSEILREKSEKGPAPSYDKIAYITIDDGPSKYTDSILDILEENNVKATFFMINKNMSLHKEEVKRIYEDGHGAGFHSVSHEIKQLYKTPQITVDEFNTCRDNFYEITGAESNLIRLPYGSKPYAPKESFDALQENNFLVWDWNLDTEDWKSSPDKILSNILLYGRDKKELVILMHEKEQSVDALENIIKILKERGYAILPIKENIPQMNYWNENL